MKKSLTFYLLTTALVVLLSINAAFAGVGFIDAPESSSVIKVLEDAPDFNAIIKLKNATDGTAYIGVEKLKRKTPQGIQLTAYPKTTYDIGEEFDSSDAVLSIVYGSGDKEATLEYAVDTTAFNKDTAGTYDIIFTYTGGLGTFAPIIIKVTVRAAAEISWKTAAFGQSASYSGVTVNDGGSVKVTSWDGMGKIAPGHDGIAFYYTRVPTSDNFVVTADVTVNQFTTDELRHGHEGFGIMARDAVPFAYRTDGNGVDLIIYQDKDYTEVDVYQRNSGNALTDGDGTPLFTEEAAARIAARELEPRVIYNSKGATYNGDYGADSVFASNIVIAGANPGVSFPSTSSAYYKERATINRIMIKARTGVTASDGSTAGTMTAPLKTNTMELMDMNEDEADWGWAPKADETYTITLQKTNSGFTSWSSLKGNDSITECPKTIYEPDILCVQDEEYMYVGFFAARWSEITVSNFSITTSCADTDAPASHD